MRWWSKGERMHYPGPESWESLDRSFFAHPEQRSTDPGPARHITHMQHYFIDPVE